MTGSPSTSRSATKPREDGSGPQDCSSALPPKDKTKEPSESADAPRETAKKDQTKEPELAPAHEVDGGSWEIGATSSPTLTGVQIKQAAAWRFKYRLKDASGADLPRTNIPPRRMAWHRQNRGGMKPNHIRVEQLLLDLCGQWDADEADHQSVSVENAPGADLTKMDTYNNEFRVGDTKFFVCDGKVEGAAASHSHLNLLLGNILGGAQVSSPKLQIYCVNGRLSLEMIMRKDKDMGLHAQRGLLWEKLSHTMEIEEPKAFCIIQAALNDKNTNYMVRHEMEHLNGLADCIVDIGVHLTDQFNWRLLRDKLIDEGGSVIAESPEFIQIVEVVRRSLGGNARGAGGYNHWAEMKLFHEQMVNPKLRRVRLSTFALLYYVPLDFPRARNAIFRRMYSGPAAGAEQISLGNVFMKTVNTLKHLEEKEWLPCLKFAESVLERWHITFRDKGAFKHMAAKMEQSLWSRVEPNIIAKLLPPFQSKTPAVDALEELRKVCATEDHFVRGSVPTATRRHLPDPLDGAAVAAADGQTKQVHNPEWTCEMDASGRVVRSSMPRAQESEVNAKIEWHASLQSAQINVERCSVVKALWAAHSLVQAQPVQISGVRGKVRGYASTKVILTKDVAPYELALVPVVKGPEAVVTKTTQKTTVLRVSVTPRRFEEGEPTSTDLFILPSTSQKDDDLFMPPYWCMASTVDEHNMEIVEIQLSAILSVLDSDEEVRKARNWQNDHESYTVPIATNSKFLTKGTELKLKRVHVEKPDTVAKSSAVVLAHAKEALKGTK